MWAESAGEGRGSVFIVELNRSRTGDPTATESAEPGDDE